MLGLLTLNSTDDVETSTEYQNIEGVVTKLPKSLVSASPSPLSSGSEQMSPKMNWIFSSACCSLEEPCTELCRMSEAKRALRELGAVALAWSGSEGPIMALHSSTAFSLVRMSIKQGPLRRKLSENRR